MRVRCLLTGMVVLVAAGMLTVPSYAKIDQKTIVGVWLLDKGSGETIKDISGNGHEGEIAGNVNWVQGKIGKALEFPGISGNMVRIPPKSDLNLMTFTIVAWYKGTSTGSWQYLVSKEVPHTSRNYSIGVQKDTEKLMVQFTVGAENWKTATGNTQISNEEWCHVAGTYDGAFIKAWVDGMLDGETAEAGKPDHVEDRHLTIGAVNGIPVKGIIDEVALFNVALEEEDIQTIMTKGLEKALSITAVSPKEKLTTTWGRIKSLHK